VSDDCLTRKPGSLERLVSGVKYLDVRRLPIAHRDQPHAGLVDWSSAALAAGMDSAHDQDVIVKLLQLAELDRKVLECVRELAEPPPDPSCPR
jgi:hypothetical protein